MKHVSLIALLISTYSFSFASGTCNQFSGNYVVSNKGCFEAHSGKSYPDNLYRGMVISAQISDDKLSMNYLTGDKSGFTVSYLADGKEHPGDIYNSGKTYTASCDSSQILSTRNGVFVAPWEMSFVKNSDGTFTLTETVTSADPFTRSCVMIRTP